MTIQLYVTSGAGRLYFTARYRPYRLAVRTPPFHGGGTGSIPVRVAIWFSKRSKEVPARPMLLNAARRFVGFLFLLDAFGGGFAGAKIADLAGELDFVAGDLAGEFDAKVLVRELESFHKENFILGDFALGEIGFAHLAVAVRTQFAGEFFAVDLEIEGVFLEADLGVEIRLPFAGDIRRARGRHEAQGQDGHNQS